MFSNPRDTLPVLLNQYGQRHLRREGETVNRIDAELIDAVIAGECQAFGVLVERYGQSVCRRIAAKTYPWMDREALCQEVFITAHRKLTQLRDKDRFEAWLCHIADNCARKSHRRHFVQVELPSDDQLGETCLVEPAVESDGETMIKARLRTALGRLAGRQREVLMQHYLQGKSYREIGLSLNCKENTIRSRLQKARARMRKEMDIMSKDMKSKNVIALDRQALQAIIAAAKAVDKDKVRQRPVRGVLLENSGRVVGTDGRHIVIRECAALRNLTENVVILPPESLDKLDVRAATLVVGISEAVLHVVGGDDLQIPVLDEKYPEYLHVFPTSWRYSISMPFGKLRAMSEKMLQYLPEMEACNGAPVAKFIFSVPEQELSIRIVSSSGSSGKAGKEEDFPVMHSTSLKGKIRTNGQVDDVMALTMNYQFFMNVIYGLCLSDDEVTEMRVIDGRNPVLISSGRPDSISAIMPMTEK